MPDHRPALSGREEDPGAAEEGTGGSPVPSSSSAARSATDEATVPDGAEDGGNVDGSEHEPLSPIGADGSGTAARPRSSGVVAFMWALPVTLAALVADQATKTWAVSSLRPGAPVPVVWTLQLNLTFNSGVAFSGLRGGGVWLVPLALLVVAAVLYLGRHVATRAGFVALGLIAGGALGNIVDRLLRSHDGAVVDFLDLQWWPIFNVADMAVVAGGILLVVSMLGEKSPEGEAGTNGATRQHGD